MYDNNFSSIMNTIMNDKTLIGLIWIPIVFIILSLIIVIISIISLMKIFKKAGKPGIYAIIPIYNIIVMCQIIKMSLVQILLILIPFIGPLIFTCFYNVKLAKAFGKSTGFAVGLIFLNVIFMPILAFSDVKYKYGNKNNDKVSDISNNEYIVANKINESIQTNNNSVSQKPNSESIDNTNIVLLNDNNYSNPDVNAISNPITNVDNFLINNPSMYSENTSPKNENFNINNMFNANLNSTNIGLDNQQSTQLQQGLKDFDSISNTSTVSTISNDNLLSKTVNTTVIEKETPVQNSKNILTNKKICKNCGKELPNIVSICPNCRTDNE